MVKGAVAAAVLLGLTAGGARAAEIHHDRREIHRDHRELRLEGREYRRDLHHYRRHARHDVRYRRYVEARRSRAYHRWRLHEGVR